MEKGRIIWIMGRPSSGKTTIATQVADTLKSHDILCVHLDGDIIRKGLCSDLGFTVEDRTENLRRVCEVAKIFVGNGFIVIASFITPHIEHRAFVRTFFSKLHIPLRFAYTKASFNECKCRDVKGLYKKASAGKISNFTGVGQSYQTPLSSERVFEIDTEHYSIKESVNLVLHSDALWEDHSI